VLTRLERRDHLEIKAAHAGLIARFPLISAVVSGVQEGQVFADDSRQTWFVATKSGFSLLGAVGQSPAADRALLDFLRDNHALPGYIHIYRPPPSFREFVSAHWKQSKVRQRAQFRTDPKAPAPESRRKAPPGYRIATIQEVGTAKLERFALELGHRYWNSEQDFLGKAIGACVVDARDEPVAICYAACVVDGIAEMDTLVLPDHRGKGLMRIVSEPFLNLAIENRLTAHWDTFVANTPSYVLAQKLGLQLIQEYALLSVFLRPA
jgi:RimJ/RimL family protein N-acetyltransferase